ncbi:hypothetical protein KJ693_03185, partial [bacterium]|nr:hypothetical protein [bacterium]
RNLEQMRKFYLTFPQKSQTLSAESVEEQKFQTLSGKSETASHKSAIQQTLSAKFEPMLSWSHYCELLKVEEPLGRSFYEL